MARIKRMLSLILCFALVAGYIPAPVSAEEVSQQVQEEMEEPVAEVTGESVTEETEAPTTEATEPETEATEEPITEETTEPATEATEPAVEEEPQLEYAAQEPQNAAATNEGTCGANLTWTFDETTGTLTISGTGEMYSYEDDDAPWDDYKSQITSILLPEGLTQVGYSAFDRTAITSITIPDSVTRINDYAFSSCSSLTDVDLGDGCSIYECAFYACPVKNLNLGHSGYFGFQAFTSSYITSITIAASRAQFDDGAFWNAGVKEVHFTGAAPGSVTDKDIMTGSTVSSFRDVTWYYDCSQSGWTTSSRYDAANKTWAGYTLVSENHVPVTDEAVAATCTTDGLTKGSHCSVCGEVIVAQEVIPAGHTVVDGICTGCQNYGECGNGIYWKRDENYTITFYGTGVIESGGSSGNPAFDLLVHNIIISEGITDIGTGLFGYLGRAYLGDGLQSVNIASTVTAIGANAFANCGNVSSINFNGDAPAIDANAFAGLTAIASYPDGNDTWTDVIKETYGGNITWVAVGSDSSEPSEPVPTTPPEETEPTEDGLVDLTIYAYYYVDSEYHHKTKLLTQQFVQDSLSNSMVPWLYSEGVSAVKAALDKLEDADGYQWNPTVFYNCYDGGEISEGDVMVADGNKAVYVKVESNKAVEATILLQIHTAQEDAIARTVTMPGYVIGDTVSAADVLTKVGEYYTGDNMTMSDLYDAVSWEDLLSGLEASGATAIKVAGDTVEIHVILTNAEPIGPVIGTVKQNLNVRSAPSITASIVKQLEAGTQVEILKTQTVMDAEWGRIADGWILMAYVDLDGASGDADNTCGDNLTWSFDKDTDTLTISGTGNMKSYSYDNPAPWKAQQVNIKTVVIKEGVTSIGNSAFRECTSLERVQLPESVTVIETYAFGECISLKNIVLPANVSSIGSFAFFGCSALTKMDIPAGVTTIEAITFGNCSALMRVTLPGSITGIGQEAFAYCSSLTEISIPSGVTSIGKHAFSGCGYLSNITFWGDVPIFGEDVFQGVSATAYYPANNTTWTADVKQNYGGNITWVGVATSGDCGDSVTWSYDANTRTLTISGTGDMADYSSDATNPAPWAAYGKEIINLVIENGVTGIGDYAFRDCAALHHASFPGSLTRIGEAAFPKFERELPDGSTVVYGQPFWSEIDQTVRQWYTVQMEADNEGFPYWDTTTFRNDAPIVASGVFGQNMYWEMDQDGNARIFGTGDTYEFWAAGSSLGNQPVKSIVMEEGITGINLNAFETVATVETITVASTVQTVETMAFADCQSLNTITFLGDAPTFGADCFRNVTATAIYPADNATWTAAVMQDYEGDILWIPSGAVENRVSVSLAELNGQTSVWIDGREYAVQTDGDMAYVDLSDSRAKTMMVYSYHVGDAADVHTQYPIGMKVWLLENASGYYTAARTEAFDDILQYAGMSIRVFGQKGIRMITSIEQATKTALTSGGLEGYTLKEYGTVIAWDSYLTATKPLVLDASYAKHNYAYKQGIADPVFQYVGDRMQYTNVLVDFTNDQCKNDLAMRPYMILEHENGEQITLYGGIVRRSIGYIAYQNRNVFEPGSDPYEYVWEIIRYVYGTKYDDEYIIAWSPPAM